MACKNQISEIKKDLEHQKIMLSYVSNLTQKIQALRFDGVYYQIEEPINSGVTYCYVTYYDGKEFKVKKWQQ